MFGQTKSDERSANSPDNKNKFVLVFDIRIEDQSRNNHQPDLLNKIEYEVNNVVNYVDENVEVFSCTAPAIGNDLRLVVKPATAEYWHSINRKVEAIRKNVGAIDNITIDHPVPKCSSIDQIKTDSTANT